MKYLYIILVSFAFNVYGIETAAAENKDDLSETKTAPFVLDVPDSIPCAASQTGLVVDEFQAVEDTILPPCDIIFFKSGKLEYCKIIETSPTTISYKMCDYVDGPTIIVNKSTVQKIRYANGREEIIIAEKTAPINAYVKPPKDKLATLSLIFGLSSIGIALLVGIVFIPLVLAGIILGIISLAKIARRRGELRGKGAAITGILLCALVLLLLAL
ncbi:DUF4190 domain-containing protein [Cytophaga hutchinsonii]|uniref:DUF4190 domain-containing protein n=1 Tax=Cytophaga hutchinsonii (strain ATCC 33406 / DSM 1761 / CIP 103989 / NBRC 15051 / NCIMB 9469 / D465) TaxID=269798 RepID=A0A6N4SWH0_CYTH3|nr:DUF4190 domain-containing protein [Cytophaga hutchinsonii]ABG60818.1 conserved hypothetical protein [Cytophaga hutchinsonii ATCC 33406]SFX72559.1 hypothetical protein SAMN04487930_108143 [Cytophaga hutchinsonii ATCC 33406]